MLNYISEYEGIETRVPRKEKVLVFQEPWGDSVMKVNFDGAFDHKNNRSASGVVARNSKGEVLLRCSRIHNIVLFAFAA